MNIEPLTDQRLAWADMVLISATVSQRQSYRAMPTLAPFYGVQAKQVSFFISINQIYQSQAMRNKK